MSASPLAVVTAVVDSEPSPDGRGTRYGLFDSLPNISYVAAEDPHSVTLTSTPMEEGGNWRKADNGQRVQNKRNDDGSMTVDSAVPWVEANTGFGGDTPAGWKIDSNIEAVTTGFYRGVTTYFGDDTHVTWSNTGTGTVDNNLGNVFDTQLRTEVILQNPPQGPLWPVGKQSTVSVVVEEVSSPVLRAENSYTVKWHAPYENWEEGQSFETKMQVVLDVDTPGYAIDNGSIPCSWYYYQWMAAAGFQATNTVLSVLGNGAGTNWMSGSPGGLLGSLIATIGIALNDIAPKPNHGTANFDDCMDGQDSQFPVNGGKAAVTANPQNYQMTPLLNLFYTVQPYKGDAYSTNGYVGPTKQGIARLSGRQWSGVYTLVSGAEDNN